MPNRTIDQIKGLVSASEWVTAVPNDRSDGSWEAFRCDLELTHPELSLFKNDRFPPQGIAI
jgi:hypothetical protein